MKLQFERDFSNIILKRGFEYYSRGCVTKVKIKDGIVGAIVNGTNNYHVSLEVLNGEVINTSCDCPYYYDHSECKHVTALLYYLSNQDIKEINLNKEEDIKSILDKINEKQLKLFLTTLIRNDENIYDIFRRQFIDYFPKISPATYKRKIENAIREAGGKDGFIDYDEGWEYTRKMYEFTNEAQKLVDKRDYETAFTISKIILDSIPNTAIDGSNGETGEVADACIEVIISILDDAPRDNAIIQTIFDYIVDEIMTHTLDNYGIDLDDLIINFIHDDLYLEECEKVLLMAIKDCDESKWYSYSKNKYLEYLNELYDKIEDTSKKINLIKDNLDTLEMLKKYIDILKKEKSVSEIISILLNYRREYPKHQEYITDKLLEIYEENNMVSEYKDELYQAFFNYKKYDFETYIKIKKMYGKNEWTTEGLNIISKLEKSSDSYNILTKIFIEEKMIEKLYNLVKDKSDISHYEEYLLPKYRNELIEKNIEKCKKNLRFASNRSNYRSIAGELNHIKILDVNSKYIGDFLEFIRKEYANRPALMDEISHIK